MKWNESNKSAFISMAKSDSQISYFFLAEISIDMGKVFQTLLGSHTSFKNVSSEGPHHVQVPMLESNAFEIATLFRISH